MHEPVTRKDDGQDPAQLAAQIRTLTGEVWRRVQEWHDSPGWQDTQRNRRRYDLTANAVAKLDELQDVPALSDLEALAKAIEPILAEWQPALAGSEQAIYAAVDRLRSSTEMVGRRELPDEL